MEKMFVIDENFGDYVKAGPFSSVRLDSVEDDKVVLLCGDFDPGKPNCGQRRVRVSWGFGIFLEEVEE